MQGKMWEHSAWSCHSLPLAQWLPSQVLWIAVASPRTRELQGWCVSHAAVCTAQGHGEERELTAWSLSMSLNQTTPTGQRERCLSVPCATQPLRREWGNCRYPHRQDESWASQTAHRERQEARKGKALRQLLTAPHTLWGAVQEQPKANAHHQILKSPESEPPYCS